MKAGILILVILFGLGYVTRSLFKSFIISATSDKSAECLEMVGSTTTEESGITYIVGSVRNNCERKFSDVIVVFKLDRASGSSGSLSEYPISAYAHSVEPRQTKQFKTVVPISKDSTYRFDRINAY